MNISKEKELEINKKSRRVVNVTSSLICLVIANLAIVFFGYSNLYWSIISSLYALLVAFCGYSGAKYKNISILACFSWCNILNFFCIMVNVIYGIFLAIYAMDLNSSCINNEYSDCDKYDSIFWVYFVLLIIISLVYMLITCLSFCFGRQLYIHPYFNNLTITLPPSPPIREEKPTELVKIVTPDGLITPVRSPKVQQPQPQPQHANIVPTIIIRENQQRTSNVVNPNSQQQQDIPPQVIYIVKKNEQPQPIPIVREVVTLPPPQNEIRIVKKYDNNEEEEEESKPRSIHAINREKEVPPPPPPRRKVFKEKEQPEEEEENYELPSDFCKNQKQCKAHDSDDDSDY